MVKTVQLKGKEKLGFLFLTILAVLIGKNALAQGGHWQQQVKYSMQVSMNTETDQLTGTQTITYVNNAPDTLHRIFIHLYWNAFQPNSSMDVRSRELGEKVVGTNKDGTPKLDWDARVKDRIMALNKRTEGNCLVKTITINGKLQPTKMHETILEVNLTQPILPGKTTVLKTEFESQVPSQIRRSGKNNAEGIQYSMSQWYPKIAGYDQDGWHPNPYVAREFYGVWGDFEVNITLPKNYKVGASGVLQNANEIGWGYDKEGTPLKPINGNTRTWKFEANNVHDFVWAADPEYKHIIRKTGNGPLLHFIYQENVNKEYGWQKTADSITAIFPYLNETFGKYPWPVYSFIQGGDGAMEYAMATLVKSNSISSMIHELMHSWYQQLMGTNESLYAWMDEGFTTFAQSLAMHTLRRNTGSAHHESYNSYYALARSGREEPLTTHADHYRLNFAYTNAVYSKGAVFLNQLGYIVGEEVLHKILHNYYLAWRFKSPKPDDFLRIAEKTSGLELDWYKEYWVNSTKTIDYKIDSIWMAGGQTLIRLHRLGDMPMPIDVRIKFKDSTSENHYIPLNLMYGEKKPENENPVKNYIAQRWTHRAIIIATNRQIQEIVEVEIDPTQRMADLDRRSNKLTLTW